MVGCGIQFGCGIKFRELLREWALALRAREFLAKLGIPCCVLEGAVSVRVLVVQNVLQQSPAPCVMAFCLVFYCMKLLQTARTVLLRTFYTIKQLS